MCVCVCVRKEGDCFVWVCGGLWLGDTRESRVCGLRCESQMGVGMKHVLAMFSTKFLKERQTNHASKQEDNNNTAKEKQTQTKNAQTRQTQTQAQTDTETQTHRTLQSQGVSAALSVPLAW